MSYKSVDEFVCHHDARGFLTKVTFASADGTTVSSSTAPDAAADSQIRHTLDVGEKINSVTLGELEVQYILQDGPDCMKASNP